MEVSKGIPNDIDLTEDEVFADGVGDILQDRKLVAGELPWDHNGIALPHNYRAQATGHFVESTFDFEIDDMYTIFSDTDAIRILNTEIEYDDDFMDGISLKSYHEYMDRITKKYPVTEDPASIIPYFKYFDIRISANGVSAFPRSIRSYKKDLTYSPYAARGFDKFMWTPDSTSSDFAYINQTMISSSSRFITTPLYAISNRMDNAIILLPDSYKSVQLSDEELNGEVLICGTGEELKLKVKKYNFIQEVKELIKKYGNHETPWSEERCRICGRTYINGLFGDDDKDSLCQECRETVLDFNHSMIHYTSAINFCDFSSVTMRGKPVGLLSDIDDQSDNTSDTIDFFRQPSYTDRGLYIIRFPRDSHELTIDIKTGLSAEDEDEDNIIRRRGRHKPKLTYDADDYSIDPEFNEVLGLLVRHLPSIGNRITHQ